MSIIERTDPTNLSLMPQMDTNRSIPENSHLLNNSFSTNSLENDQELGINEELFN